LLTKIVILVCCNGSRELTGACDDQPIPNLTKESSKELEPSRSVKGSEANVTIIVRIPIARKRAGQLDFVTVISPQKKSVSQNWELMTSQIIHPSGFHSIQQKAYLILIYILDYTLSIDPSE
jgi:hypothetical protein